jgi:hypothetical protein
MSKLRTLAVSGIAAAFLSVPGLAFAAPDANAVKFCQDAYKNGWTLTNEQVAQCESAGVNKFTEPVVVTNPGGNTPPGQQPV